MTSLDTSTNMASIVDDLIARGDLSKLSAEQRVTHYHNVCRSIGLNPLTQPFMYVMLNGRLTLYAKRDAADQLRKLNGISVKIAGRDVIDGLLTVHVRATDKTGRDDEDYGVVSVAGLRGEAAANAFMKAVTKAKRRVTLSISGLGFLDESEIDPEAEPVEHAFPNLAKPLEPAGPIAAPAEVEHVEPYRITPPAGDDDWRTWAQTYIASARTARSPEELARWAELNLQATARMAEVEPKMHRMLNAAIEKHAAVVKQDTPADDA